MEQEDKNLLLQDLCGRLPYGVKMINTEPYSDEHNPILTLSYISEDNAIGCRAGKGFMTTSLGSIKPYLFPLSSMTEEQTKEVHNLIYQGISESVDETKEWLKTRKENELRPITLTYILSYTLVIDWFCKNHFDYRGLIPKGLAIDATGLNIY